MTMRHIARSYRVSLHVEHPSMDPVGISHALGLLPRRVVQAGAPRATLQGAPRSGVYPATHWSHDFQVEAATDLGPLLRNLLGSLAAHRAFFRRIVEDGGTVELFCGVFADGNWDEILGHALLGALARLRIDLRLDVYPRRKRAA